MASLLSGCFSHFPERAVIVPDCLAQILPMAWEVLSWAGVVLQGGEQRENVTPTS